MRAIRKDARVHHVSASAEGYEPKLEDVFFASDVSIDVSLDRRAAALRGLATSPRRPVARRQARAARPPAVALPSHATTRRPLAAGCRRASTSRPPAGTRRCVPS